MINQPGQPQDSSPIDAAVAWREYGPEAFALARELGRPVLVDVGAVWCHWCHVMDRTTYEHRGVARLVNERFVPVRVDRDRRPEVDRRLQQAVAAYQLSTTGQASGGWPLTAFLTPAGWLLHGETYMPPERFLRVAATVADYYRDHQDEIARRGETMTALLAERRAPGESPADRLADGIAEALIAALSAQYDARHGGFGSAPKFPAPPALAFLIRASADRDDPRLLGMALKTLAAMAAGGIRDHVGGGFHRYSTDARWVVPHFEKLLDVNAGLLDNYLDLARAADSPLARDVAADIIRFADEVLSDRERGGFYASQDADIGLHDDGAYFTWTLADFRAAVPAYAEALARSYFGVAEVGEMEETDGRTRRPTDQNVLHATKTLEQLAALNGITVDAARSAVERALTALRLARQKRVAPLVDRTILVDWNAAMIRAYLKASLVLDRSDCRDFALKTIDRLLAQAYDGDSGMAHAILPDGSLSGRGLLQDNIWFAAALLDACEITGERRYLDAARGLADLLIATLWDRRGGGFFDAASLDEAGGVLAQPHKDIQDHSLASGNALAAEALIRLAEMTGARCYRTRAEQALASFGDLPKQLGVLGAGLALAVDRLRGNPAHLVVIGPIQDAATRALHHAALAVDHPRRTVQVLDPGRDADLLKALGLTAPVRPALLVCGRDFCLEPAFDASDLPARLADLRARRATPNPAPAD